MTYPRSGTSTGLTASFAALLATGGSADDFEEIWPDMLDPIRDKGVESGMDRRQRSTERSYRGRF